MNCNVKLLCYLSNKYHNLKLHGINWGYKQCLPRTRVLAWQEAAMDFNARRFNSLFQTTRQDRILRPDINYIPMIDFMIIMVYCVGILTILFSSFNG